MKMTNIKTETYVLDDKWMVDIQTKDDCFEAYLWHKWYGVKELIFGFAIKQNNLPDTTYEDFIDMVESEWEDYKCDYIERYFDDADNTTGEEE